jgi:Patatin-like phospholipase
MTIEHLFIGGGYIYGFSFFGLLKQLHMNNVWELKNIKSMYGISSGAMIGTMISLNLEWDVLQEYLINRPWERLFNLNMYSLFNSIQNRGVFSKAEFYDIFRSLFLAKDISCDITMLEFYEHTGIEHYYIVSEMNSLENRLESLTISYKTHPNWKLLDVVYMSSCLPMLFSPIIMEHYVYLDGIFSFKKKYIDDLLSNNDNYNETALFITLDNEEDTKPIDIQSSLLDYLICFLLSLIKPDNRHFIDCKYNYKIKIEPFNLERLLLIINNRQERVRLVNLGINMNIHLSDHEK